MNPCSIISYRPDKGPTPVHRSTYNPKDASLVISVLVTPEVGKPRVHHVFEDGSGTMSVNDIHE